MEDFRNTYIFIYLYILQKLNLFEKIVVVALFFLEQVLNNYTYITLL